MVGIETALSTDPKLPRDWQHDKDNAPMLRPIRWKSKTLGSLANMAVVKFQLKRLSEGRTVDPHVSPLNALMLQQLLPDTALPPVGWPVRRAVSVMVAAPCYCCDLWTLTGHP